MGFVFGNVLLEVPSGEGNISHFSIKNLVLSIYMLNVKCSKRGHFIGEGISQIEDTFLLTKKESHNWWNVYMEFSLLLFKPSSLGFSCCAINGYDFSRAVTE